jgi:hypothetical protein
LSFMSTISKGNSDLSVLSIPLSAWQQWFDVDKSPWVIVAAQEGVQLPTQHKQVQYLDSQGSLIGRCCNHQPCRECLQSSLLSRLCRHTHKYKIF